MKELESIIVDELAEEMQRTMDFDVLCDVMIRVGWAVVEVNYYRGDGDDTQTWMEVKNWVDQNCTGQHQEHLGKWLFEDTKDATMFALKWKTK